MSHAPANTKGSHACKYYIAYTTKAPNIVIVVLVTVSVTILFPYHSILLIIHSPCFLTWRGSVHFLNTAYLLVHSSSTFSLVSLSLDVPIS